MTIVEIESILHTLCLRHKNFSEELLVTLLTSAGWEDKYIKDALALFRSNPSKYKPSPDVVNASITGNLVVGNNNTPAIAGVAVGFPKEEFVHMVETVPDVKIDETSIVEKDVHETASENNETLTNVSLSIKDFVTPTVTENTAAPLVIEASVQTTSSDIVYYNNTGEEEKIAPIIVENATVSTEDVTQTKQEALIPEMPTIEEGVQKIEQLFQSEFKPELEVPLIDIGKAVDINSLKQSVPEVEEEISLPIVQAPVYVEESVVAPPVALNPQELQSLVVPEQVKVPPQVIHIPENLPLKPFESTQHTWPFSKYKEVFHSDGVLSLAPEERVLVNAVTTPTLPPVVATTPKKVKIKRTGFDGEDEGLIFLTATTLLIILLLLAYMYGNGRI